MMKCESFPVSYQSVEGFILVLTSSVDVFLLIPNDTVWGCKKGYLLVKKSSVDIPIILRVNSCFNYRHNLMLHAFKNDQRIKCS